MADSIRLDQTQTPHGISAADQAIEEFNKIKSEQTAPGFVESFKISAELDNVANNAANAAEGWRADYLSSQKPQPNVAEFKQRWGELSKGHTPDEQDAILEHAGDYESMVRVSREIKARRAQEEKLAKAGWTGVGARVLANLADPTAIAATVASDGLAAPWLYAGKLSKVAKTVRGAAYGAATNVALEGVNAAAQENYDGSNLLIALGTGGALGGLTAHLPHKAHPEIDHDDQLAHAAGRLADEAQPNPFAHLKPSQQQFVKAVLPHAEAVAQKMGIDPMLIVAQAAHETGWKVSTKGNNLFGIKVGKGWTGKVQDVATHEVVNGQSVAITDKFRAYDSIEDSIADHMSFLHTNKRYANVLQHGNDADSWFAELQRAGYATDPAYAKKLSSLYKSLKGIKSSDTGALPDSVGAARNIHQTDGVHPQLEDDLSGFVDEETFNTRLATQIDSLKGYKTKSAMVNRWGSGSFLNHDNPVMKWVGKHLLSDGIEGGEDAALHVDMINHKFASRWGSEHHNAFSEFKQWYRQKQVDEGVEPGMLKRFTGIAGAEARKEFDIMIGKAQRGETEGIHPAALRMADRMGQDNVEILRNLKAAGVAGTEEITENSNYLTRQWLPHQFRELSAQYGDYQVQKLLKESIRSATADIDDTLADKLAGAIYKRMRHKAASVGDDGVFQQPLFGRDNREALEDFLDMIDPHGEEVDIRKDVAAWFDSADAIKRDQSGAASSNFKRKIDLDEKFSMELRHRDGSVQTVRLHDLLENDATKLHTNYIRQMSGHIALAKMGIKGNKEWKTLMMHMERHGDELGHASQDIAKAKKDAEIVRNLLLGKPVDQWRINGAVGEALQASRDIAFTRMMGQVGLASITELGTVASSIGLKAMLKHMPNMKATLTGMTKPGAAETPLFKELESIFGTIGSGFGMNPPKLVDTAAGVTASAGRNAFNAFSTSAQAAKRVVSTVAGHHLVTSNLERLAFTGIAQKFLDTAHGSKWNPKRLAYLGMDEKMTQKVLSEIRTHSTYEDNPITGRKLLTLGHDKWTDLEAKEAFQMATYREARRIVQQNLLGEAPLYLNSDLGKTLGQFRAFQLAAFTKNTLHNWHMMDEETLANFSYGMLVGAFVYSLQTVMNAQGRDDEEKYLQKHMTGEAIGKGAFSKAGFSSLIPGLVDTAASLSGGLLEQQFNNTRSSGLASDFFGGNPTVANINSAAGAVRAAVGTVNPDYKFSKADVKNTAGMLALSNTYGIRNLMNILMSDLPSQSLPQKQE